MMRNVLQSLALGSILVLLAGCDEDLTAVTGTVKPFTVYAVLSPDLATQKALVFPIEGRLALRDTLPIDAVVMSRDLNTGDERVWSDSLTVDSLGLYERVFSAPFKSAYAHTYRLTITRSDGAVSEVETTVPPRTEIRTLPAVVFPGLATLPALIEGDAPRLLKIVVTYTVSYRETLGRTRLLRVPISYDGKQKQVPEGWQVPIDLRSDFKTIERAAALDVLGGLDPSYGLQLHRIRLQLIVASEEWDPPNGVFDPEVIVQPGTMSNVENGFGFVAAGYRHDRDLNVPDTDVLQAAGFAR